MPFHAPPSSPVDAGHLSRPGGAGRWRRAWSGSLRFRLLALGLMPLLVAFPAVIAALVLVGGERADALLQANLRSSLAGARSYLDGLKADTGARVAQLARSQRLAGLVRQRPGRAELDHALRTAAEGTGLDYLLVVDAEGLVHGSSTGVEPGRRLAETHTLRQAAIGVASVAYERFDADALGALSPEFPQQARQGMPTAADGRHHGLLVHAAAHFPLTVDMPDRVLVGGVLFNRNFALIEHLRQVIFPVGSLPDDAEGMTAILVGDTSAASSRQRLQGQREIGSVVDPAVRAAVLDAGRPWLGTRTIAGLSSMAGYEPLVDGTGQRVGMLMAAFPDGPYRRMTWVLLGITAALLALTMLAISVVFLRTGRELSQRLAQIEGTMGAARAGDREARVGEPLRDDELGRLARHFDELLATVAAQERNLESQVQQRTREVHERTEQLDAIFALSPDGLVSFDEQRRVRFANEAFARMVGCEAALLVGLGEAEFSMQLARQSAAVAGFPGLAALREAGDGATFELVRPSRRVLAARVQQSSAAHVSQVLYVRDVTHETEVDRMKSEFLTTAAHELRTPMTSIYGYVELLLGRELPPPRQRAVLETVSRQSTLMMAIINQLLDLARIEARRGSDFAYERLDLAAVAAATAADYQPPAGREPPRIAAADAALPVQADAQKLQQALLNIVSNAYKYSPAGGAVEVAFHRGHRGGRPHHGVSVRDHGIGMSEAQRERVFERFYRADASGNIPGTGLGMSIVEEIVELHGGSVEIDSRLGQGTCMTVWLPAA